MHHASPWKLVQKTKWIFLPIVKLRAIQPSWYSVSTSIRILRWHRETLHIHKHSQGGSLCSMLPGISVSYWLCYVQPSQLAGYQGDVDVSSDECHHSDHTMVTPHTKGSRGFSASRLEPYPPSFPQHLNSFPLLVVPLLSLYQMSVCMTSF